MKSGVCLYGVGGDLAGAIIELDNCATLIGRDTNKCSIIYPENTPGISSVHCQVKPTYPYIEVMDLGSRYGTFNENGVRLEKDIPYQMKNGDSFYLGDKKNKFMVKITK